MSTAVQPLAELTASAIRILCREIGPANTGRFLGQFTKGFGNYTEERDQLLGSMTVDEIVDEIYRLRAAESPTVEKAPE